MNYELEYLMKNFHLKLWSPVLTMIALSMLIYINITGYVGGSVIKPILGVFIGSNKTAGFWLLVLAFFYIYSFAACREVRSKGGHSGVYVSWFFSLAICFAFLMVGVIVGGVFSGFYRL